MKAYKPLGNRIVFKEDAAPEKQGLIWLPRLATKPASPFIPHTGTVIARGPKVDPAIKIGDRILIARLMPISIIESEKLLVINADDVLGVLEE